MHDQERRPALMGKMNDRRRVPPVMAISRSKEDRMIVFLLAHFRRLSSSLFGE
jgi:hypothetical protein